MYPLKYIHNMEYESYFRLIELSLSLNNYYGYIIIITSYLKLCFVAYIYGL